MIKKIITQKKYEFKSKTMQERTSRLVSEDYRALLDELCLRIEYLEKRFFVDLDSK